MTRIAEMYADRDSNDVGAHCETLPRVVEKRSRNRANKEPMMTAMSSALDSISTSIEDANFGSFSDDGVKLSDVIKAMSDTIKTIELDEDLTVSLYQSFMKMNMLGKGGRRKGQRPGRPDFNGWNWEEDFDEDEDYDDGEYDNEYNDYYGDQYDDGKNY